MAAKVNNTCHATGPQTRVFTPMVFVVDGFCVFVFWNEKGRDFLFRGMFFFWGGGGGACHSTMSIATWLTCFEPHVHALVHEWISSLSFDVQIQMQSLCTMMVALKIPGSTLYSWRRFQEVRERERFLQAYPMYLTWIQSQSPVQQAMILAALDGVLLMYPASSCHTMLGQWMATSQSVPTDLTAPTTVDEEKKACRTRTISYQDHTSPYAAIQEYADAYGLSASQTRFLCPVDPRRPALNLYDIIDVVPVTCGTCHHSTSPLYVSTGGMDISWRHCRICKYIGLSSSSPTSTAIWVTMYTLPPITQEARAIQRIRERCARHQMTIDLPLGQGVAALIPSVWCPRWPVMIQHVNVESLLAQPCACETTFHHLFPSWHPYPHSPVVTLAYCHQCDHVWLPYYRGRVLCFTDAQMMDETWRIFVGSVLQNPSRLPQAIPLCAPTTQEEAWSDYTPIPVKLLAGPVMIHSKLAEWLMRTRWSLVTPMGTIYLLTFSQELFDMFPSEILMVMVSDVFPTLGRMCCGTQTHGETLCIQEFPRHQLYVVKCTICTRWGVMPEDNYRLMRMSPRLHAAAVYFYQVILAAEKRYEQLYSVLTGAPWSNVSVVDQVIVREVALPILHVIQTLAQPDTIPMDVSWESVLSTMLATLIRLKSQKDLQKATIHWFQDVYIDWVADTIGMTVEPQWMEKTGEEKKS
jgi:hypothetical protein